MKKNNKVTSAVSIAIVAMIMVTCAAYAFTDEKEEQYVEDDATLGGIPLLVGIILVSMAAGWILNDLLTDGVGPGGSQEEVNAVLRQLESEKVIWYGNGTASMAGSIMPSNANLLGFTNLHWNRAAELAVAGSWAINRSYNPNLTTELSTLRENIQAFIYTWQNALDEAYTRNIIAQINTFNTEAHLQAMTTQLVWDTGSAELRNSIIDWGTLVKNAAFGQTVYIDASQETTGGTYFQNTSGTLYNLTTTNIIMREMATGRTVTLAPGSNDMSLTNFTGTTTKMASGLYRIETGGSTIAGPLSKAADSNAAEVFGTMVHLSDTYRWFTFENGQTRVNSVGQIPIVTNNLSIQIGYVDRFGNNAIDRSVLVGPNTDGQDPALIESWQNIIAATNLTVEQSAQAGQVLWGIFDICEMSIPALAPSSITTTIPGVTLNAVQASMLALDQMMQIAQAYLLHGNKLNQEIPVLFSADSLDLYIRADIYFNGTLLYENVVFTPFTALERQDFVTGKTTEWTNTGFIQVWGFTTDISDWSGPVNTSDYRTLPVGNGYDIDVKQIGRLGNIVTSASIIPNEIGRFGVGTGGPPGVINPPQVGGATSNFALILMLIGALLIGIGIARPNLWFLFLAGAILIGVGAWIFFGLSIWSFISKPSWWFF